MGDEIQRSERQHSIQFVVHSQIFSRKCKNEEVRDRAPVHRLHKNLPRIRATIRSYVRVHSLVANQGASQA